jgi:predicted alpha/beta hydrolase
MQTQTTHSASSSSSCAERIELVASDGYPLGGTLFQPRMQPQGTVIIHSATAVPSGFYRRFGEFLSQQGLRALTYDYRGVGLSRPKSLRGFRASMSDWAMLDAAAAHRFVAERYPGENVASVGHSFGGQLFGLLDSARDVRGAILVGAQFGFYGHWQSPLDRLRLRFTWQALVPSFTSVLGYLPGRAGLGEDLPRGVAEEWARWCTSPEYLVSHYPVAAQRFARFDKPLLFYSFSDDDFGPRPAVDALIARFSAAKLEHHHVAPSDHDGAPIGHFGFFKPRFTDTLWSDALKFFRRVLS